MRSKIVAADTDDFPSQPREPIELDNLRTNEPKTPIVFEMQQGAKIVHVKRLILVTLISLFSSPCLGQQSFDPADNPLPVGVGEETCAVWLYHHKVHDSHSLVEDSWFSGFISGYNSFVDPHIRGTFFPYDNKVLPSAISSDCNADPKQTVFSAALRFLKVQSQVHHPNP